MRLTMVEVKKRPGDGGAGGVDSGALEVQEKAKTKNCCRDKEDQLNVEV